MLKSVHQKLRSAEAVEDFLRKARKSEDIRSTRTAILEGPHPPPDLLFAYAMGELSASEMETWSKHVAHCPACADRMIVIRSIEGDVGRLIERSERLADEAREWRDILRDLEHPSQLRVNLRSRAALKVKQPRSEGQFVFGHAVLDDQWVVAESFSTGEVVAVEVQAPSGEGNISAFLHSDFSPMKIVFPANPEDEDTYVPRSKRKTVYLEAPQREGLWTLTVIWTREDFLYPHEINFDGSHGDDALQTFAESLPLVETDEWSMANCALRVHDASRQASGTGELPESARVIAVRAVDPTSIDSTYWLPLIFNDLQIGRARFGRCCGDLRSLRSKKKRSAEEKECWRHTSFLLDLREGDFMIYVNIPERNQCTIVRVLAPYDYTEVWDPKQLGELQHMVHCQFIGVFERDCVAVHPGLARRLKSKGWHWDLESMKGHVSSLLSHFL